MTVLLWDSDSEPPAGPHEVWSWKSLEHTRFGVSLPRYVEEHADTLRARYLAFVHELGEAQIAGKRLVDHYAVDETLSLWWLTLIAEKSPFKSPRIYDCLRLLALENILAERRPSGVELVTADSDLTEAVHALCGNLGVEFRRRDIMAPRTDLSLRRLYARLPHPLKALISLRHLVGLWRLRRASRSQWHDDRATVFFCSYFIHLDPDSCARGQFHSGHWEVLPEFLQHCGVTSNWIHHFLFSVAVQNTDTAIAWVHTFNKDAKRQGVHTFLDSYLSWPVALRALRRWVSVSATTYRLRRVEDLFRPKNSAASFWPLLRTDWRSSTLGVVALDSCLRLELFDKVLKALPRHKLGFYLCENQGWEKALLWAWRKHGHGALVGVVHATVPFWHLYYFDDPRTVSSTERNGQPLPDRVALNGPAAWQAFVNAGYPVDRLVQVEALRYLSLVGARARRPQTGNRSHGGTRRVLVLGGIDPIQMRRMLRALEQSAQSLRGQIFFALKPHPSTWIDPRDYPGLALEMTSQPLASILDQYDAAIAHHTTSAGIDAHQGGLPCLVFLDGESLNLSALRGLEGVSFVSTPDEVAAALQFVNRDGAPIPSGELFWLDAQLPKWKQLLKYSA